MHGAWRKRVAVQRKSPGEIEAMAQACVVAAQALQTALGMLSAGVSTLKVDQAAEQVIRDAGAVPTGTNDHS